MEDTENIKTGFDWSFYLKKNEEMEHLINY